MHLVDVKTFPKPIYVLNNIKEHLCIHTNCEITEFEINLFNIALEAMSMYISDNNVDLSNHYILNVYFTLDGSISFVEKEEGNLGRQVDIALYRMQILRELDSIVLMLFVFIEELAHYFLRIYDETVIKYKVAEIIKYILPDFNLNDMKGIGLNGLQ